MNELLKNNIVEITGEVISDFEFSHEIMDEKYYLFRLASRRASGNTDYIPVMVSERLISIKSDYIGKFLKISGQLRSYNFLSENKKRLLIFVFARGIETIEAFDCNENTNFIILNASICKEPVYRITPSGREISDVLVASNRLYNKSDYIPCICWGGNARFISRFPVGTKVEIEGRVQSREYLKKFEDGSEETRVAYEVSVNRIDVAESEENEDGSRSEENL